MFRPPVRPPNESRFQPVPRLHPRPRQNRIPNEKGISGEAIDYLEQVRARARGTNTNILPKVTTTDQGELRDVYKRQVFHCIETAEEMF